MILAIFEPDFRPRSVVLEKFLNFGVFESISIRTLFEVYGMFVVIKFTLNIAFELVTHKSKLGFGSFVFVKLEKKRFNLLIIVEILKNFVDCSAFKFNFFVLINFKRSVVTDESFAKFMDSKHIEDFLEIEGVIKLRMNSDGEHLSAVDMLGDTFEAVAVNAPVLPTSADGVFKFITN